MTWYLEGMTQYFKNNDLASKSNNSVSQNFDLVTRSNDLVSQNYNLVTKSNNLVSQSNALCQNKLSK